MAESSTGNPAARSYLSAQERDERSPVWDMSQERVFTETLLHQRFNFFLVVFGAIVAASVNARTEAQLRAFLTGGTVLSVLLFVVLVRTQRKVLLIRRALLADEGHAYTVIDRLAKNRWTKILDQARIVGYVIPALCVSTLITLTTMAFCGRL
jgi:hypothetical protein